MKLKTFIGLVLLDQITKFLAFRDFFDFCPCINPTKNYGLVFSFSFGVYDLAISFLVLILFVWYLVKSETGLRSNQIYLLLILAGGASNLFDRILFGYVRDFVNLAMFTINIADLYLLFGVLLALRDSNRN